MYYNFSLMVNLKKNEIINMNNKRTIVIVGYQILRAKISISTDAFRTLLLKMWLASKSISIT